MNRIIQKNSIVVFDAVGTLIYPEPNVAAVYHRLGRKYNLEVPLDDISSRFKSAMSAHFGKRSEDDPELHADPFRSSDLLERAKWKQIVGEVFSNELAKLNNGEVRPTFNVFEELFNSLWDHFADPNHWRLFDDVNPCLTKLSDTGATIGIVSNFDGRIHTIVSKLLPTIDPANVFCSADVGWLKPSPNFYRVVEQQLGIAATKPMIVGDDQLNDVIAPANEGWSSVWLRRKIGKGPEDFGDDDPDQLQELGQDSLASVNSLSELGNLS